MNYPYLWRRPLRALDILGGIAVLMLLGIGFSLSDEQKSPIEGRFKPRWAQVVDGDTIRFREGWGEYTVRLVDVDTPELHRPRCADEPAAARRAAALTRHFVAQALDDGSLEVLLVGRIDDYGRQLGYVFSRTSSGQAISLSDALMVVRLARRWQDTYDPEHPPRLPWCPGWGYRI